MDIIELYNCDNPRYWLQRIAESDWSAGRKLAQLIRSEALRPLCGADTKVFLLIDGENLVSFCTYAQQDDIRDSGLSPWIGFVYTFPQYRGHRYMGMLLDHVEKTARNEGRHAVWISTDDTGLYEKYSYSFHAIMKNHHGRNSRVYTKELD